ncbi:hypothetical protein EJ070_10550 [Mesorhizobium sp. M1E.F.Ca.ET.045.02.1.1]|nr:hypothetical protein EJ070_10550 [Mesorhizobium sp. M1E.F.Ca.ET.045.02.1.1]RUW85162.1 hypothetical protein EOA29_06140 [Mesorhizobium sp. M1E.F.Ca.ET.063.01.1.1]RWB53376.1 MAG: hypothetical protein EOQ47_22145 [Mesorhizobium sp.]
MRASRRSSRSRRRLEARLPLLPLWEKVSPQATDEGCSRESRRLTPLEHPSSVSALRADPPSPTRGEGYACSLLSKLHGSDMRLKH